MAIGIAQRLATDTPEPNVDFRYGPYQNKQDTIDSVGNKATDGLTVGIWEGEGNERRIVEYNFKNIQSGTSVTTSNLVRKVSTITITQNGSSTTYYLDKGDNVDIQITGENQVNANWNESSSSSKAYIQNKPTINGNNLKSSASGNTNTSAELGLMGSVSDATNGDIPVFSNSGQVSDSGKLLANVVFFGDTITPNREITEGNAESEEPDEPVEP